MSSVIPDPDVYQIDDAVRAFGSEEVVKEALRSFLAISDVMAQDLKHAYAEGDPVKLRSKVHWIKGGLSYIHARKLKVTCVELDRQVQQDPVPDVHPLVEQVCLQLEEVNLFAQRFLAQSAASF